MNIYRMQERFIKIIPDNLDIHLMGLQGSRGHGLPHKGDADYDYRGVFVAKNEDILSMHPIKETIEVNVGAGDDEAEFVFHEIGKFFTLAMKGNPSVISLLFLPKYNIKSDYGSMIVKNRDLFLSTKAIKDAFGGYAMSQILYLKRNHKFRDGKKIAKHIRHYFRLFDQGQELLETGTMSLPVKDPEKYSKLGKEENIDKLFDLFEKRDKEFKSCKSVLPEKPDIYWINNLLLKIRLKR